jgi:hypothetical protein
MSVQGLPSLASIFSSIGSICLKLSQSQYDEEALLACAMAKADEKGISAPHPSETPTQG